VRCLKGQEEKQGRGAEGSITVNFAADAED
jgi:hypothetical protein